MLKNNQPSTLSIGKITPDTLVNVGAVSPARPALHVGTIRKPRHIYMEHTGEGSEVMPDEHRKDVTDLAFLYWQLHANESAKASGLITASMYEFAKDALHKDIAKLSVICYNDRHKAGGNSGFKVCTATA